MTIGFLRSTRSVVDCGAIYHNITAEINRLEPGVEVFAVVKANGYGHGALEVARVAKAAGATGYCVSLLDEALELRHAGFSEPILILGIVEPKHVGILAQEKLSVTVASKEWLVQASEYWHECGCQNNVLLHIKLDTGMGRLGFINEAEISEALKLIEAYEEFELEGLYTHFAKADSADKEYFHLQQQRFTKMLALFPKTLKYIHTANSATALWHQHWQSNMIRLGASMYGLNPSGSELETPYELKQAMSLESKLVHVKQLAPGERVGYGADYETTSSEWIGTLPIGYADGFTRDFTGFELLVEGQKVPIVGRICMDQCMVRLPYKLPVGTKVTIFGKNGDLSNSFQDGAEHAQTINYEIPCLLSERVPRYYVNDNY